MHWYETVATSWKGHVVRYVNLSTVTHIEQDRKRKDRTIFMHVNPEDISYTSEPLEDVIARLEDAPLTGGVLRAQRKGAARHGAGAAHDASVKQAGVEQKEQAERKRPAPYLAYCELGPEGSGLYFRLSTPEEYEELKRNGIRICWPPDPPDDSGGGFSPSQSGGGSSDPHTRHGRNLDGDG